jgi:hypothetical protein
MAIIEKIKAWYRGRYVPPPRNDLRSELQFCSVGHYEQPALAKLLKAVGLFWLAHWQWIIGTAIAVIGILVAL